MMAAPGNLEIKSLEPKELIPLLGEAHWPVREAASTALMAQGAASVGALIEGLSHANQQVRAACASLLDHLADERCAEPLRRALTDASPRVRRHAVHALGCQQCKIAPLPLDIVGLLIERALTDNSIRVRRVAVHQLGLQHYDRRAIGVLQRIVQEDTDSKLLSRAQFALKSLEGKQEDRERN